MGVNHFISSSLTGVAFVCGTCSKILNVLLFLFLNKMLFFKFGIYKMLVRIANRKDPDQTASPEAV